MAKREPLKRLSYEEVEEREKRLNQQIKQYKFMFPKWTIGSIEDLIVEIREPQHITLGYKKFNGTVHIVNYLFNENADSCDIALNEWENWIWINMLRNISKF